MNLTIRPTCGLARQTIIAGAALLASYVGALAQEAVPMDKSADITTMCGTKPMKIALIDGFGGDTWRKITHAEFLDEASKCANITDVKYSDAGGDQQKYNGDINSFVAQGVDIIVAFTDFGDAALPAYRKAFKEGVTIAPYFSHISGTAG